MVDSGKYAISRDGGKWDICAIHISTDCVGIIYCRRMERMVVKNG